MMDNNPFRVYHENKVYNLDSFLLIHPGGRNYLRNFKEKNVTDAMVKYSHSKSAYHILGEYDNDSKNDNQGVEHLVDWNQPMLKQIPNLGTAYQQWVELPVARPMRLFASNFLENLSRTEWYIVPLVWVPVIIVCFLYGTNQYMQSTFSKHAILASILYYIIGITLWTLIEYCLHRWIFHMKPSGHSKVLILAHFLMHGIHHKIPFDSTRLVFPPVPAAVIAFIVFNIVSLILPRNILFLVTSGALTGYVVYDLIHFYLHNGSPKENSYFYTMKRYHSQHHFAQQNSGFGVTSPIWDTVFGTTLKLRKLIIGIKW